MTKSGSTGEAKSETKGSKMSIRRICVDYKSEFIFGIVLGVSVLLSENLAHLIPFDFYLHTLGTILNGCVATTSILGAVLLLRHAKGVHVRYLWACILLVWAVLASLLLMHVIAYTEPFDSERTLNLRGREMAIGNFYAWLLLLYPTAVLRPGWLNVKRALYPLIPVIIVEAIDELCSVDLRWLLALYPLVCASLLIMHVRAYRNWCEENYSSMDNIDVQWIVRYLIMYVISGAAYTYLTYSYDAAHAFTQQWLLLFMLAYSTEQILFRQDPWVMVRRAKALPPEPEETPEEAEQQIAPESNEYYRNILEEWMNTEKPYLNPEFRLLDLRQVLPLNRTYLSQLINAEYGCNFYQYVTRYRIEEAKRLMRENPNMRLQDIAEQSGFSSPAVFSRIFSRETGLTPSDWSSSLDNT